MQAHLILEPIARPEPDVVGFTDCRGTWQPLDPPSRDTSC